MAVINQYTSIERAYIDKGFLVANGIPAEVESDALAQIYPGIGGLGMISLAVPDQYAGKAQKLLASRPRQEEIEN